VSKTIPIDAPRITIEVVTPQEAARMLGTMKGNRALRQRVVQRYAREMIAGKWLLNGESVKIARDGRLIDGQHRLNAVVLAKVPVQMCVVRGVDAGAMVTLDTGVGRTFADVSTIAGRSYSQATGPIIRWWFKYQTGSPTVANTPSMQEMEQILDAHPGIVESAAFIAKLTTVRQRCFPGVQGFVHSYASEKYDREMADSFMQDLNDGADLEKTNPIYVLRKRLIDTPEKKRPPATYALAWTIKAWNCWINGEKIQVIRWQSMGEAGAEDFPRFGCDVPQTKSQRNNAKLRQERAVAAAR
jgi:hypothetical protein